MKSRRAARQRAKDGRKLLGRRERGVGDPGREGVPAALPPKPAGMHTGSTHSQSCKINEAGDLEDINQQFPKRRKDAPVNTTWSEPAGAKATKSPRMTQVEKVWRRHVQRARQSGWELVSGGVHPAQQKPGPRVTNGQRESWFLG